MKSSRLDADKDFRKLRLEVGDVFVSKKMASCTYGYVQRKKAKPRLDKTVLHFMGDKAVVFEGMTRIDEDGRKVPYKLRLVPSSTTRKRFATSEWVVIDTEMSGGGSGHGYHDRYPDGWGVTAKLLVDGEWDENAPEVFFRQSGSFTNKLEVTDTKKTGKMKMVMVRIK